MTCIVAIAGTPSVLACDSLGSDGYIKQDYHNKKIVMLQTVREQKDFSCAPVSVAIGYVNSFRMGDLLTYKLKLPIIAVDQNILDYLVCALIPRVIACFDENHYSRNNEGAKYGGEFCIGIEQRVFIVQSDFSVLEPVCGYASIGSGADVALGALYASAHLPTVERAKLAVQASARFSPSVGGAVHVLQF